MRSHSYLNTTKSILQQFDGSMPLSAWLKQFFKTDKKFGSKDRKQISHLCYCFYRLGNAFQHVELEERILIANFLCSVEPNIVLEELKPEWNEKLFLSIKEKLEELQASEEEKTIFPFNEEVSNEIDIKSFNRSFLIQPDLFLRIRPGKKSVVIQQLQKAAINFEIDNDCIRLPNQSRIDDIIDLDRDAVVQDYNSQKVLTLLNPKRQTPNPILSTWDCCAASGGKSILVFDTYPDVELTVSDVRESILINLQKRFRRAGIQNYDHFLADISSPTFSIDQKFDLIICDAPCSGSGTWSRTPEQLVFFKKEKIGSYANLQKRIAVNASKTLKANGRFVYITCSVFKKENEEVVKFITEHSNLRLESMNYWKGYDKKADSLFSAVFTI